MDWQKVLLLMKVPSNPFGDCVTEADWRHVGSAKVLRPILPQYIESSQGREKLASDMSMKRNLIIKDSQKKARYLCSEPHETSQH